MLPLQFPHAPPQVPRLHAPPGGEQSFNIFGGNEAAPVKAPVKITANNVPVAAPAHVDKSLAAGGRREGGGGGDLETSRSTLTPHSVRLRDVTVRLCICVSTSQSGSCLAGQHCTWY